MGIFSQADLLGQTEHTIRVLDTIYVSLKFLDPAVGHLNTLILATVLCETEQ